VSYKSVLARGFALLNNEDGDLVRSTKQAKAGATLGVQVADGTFGVMVGGVAPKRKSRSPSSDGGQSSLF
jgi:exodeoxyribonuclease VII large subunit